MSTDPSPWADEPNPWSEPLTETTEEMLLRAAQERQEEEMESFWNRFLWEKYRHRLTKEGTLLR